MRNYDAIIEFLKSLGYNRVQEDIHINGQEYINCYNENDKIGLNITLEFY